MCIAGQNLCVLGRWQREGRVRNVGVCEVQATWLASRFESPMNLRFYSDDSTGVMQARIAKAELQRCAKCWLFADE
jgi:phosphopantothenoylcysteine synthetase/decarboxylase